MIFGKTKEDFFWAKGWTNRIRLETDKRTDLPVETGQEMLLSS
jgi:hypothetical protein